MGAFRPERKHFLPANIALAAVFAAKEVFTILEFAL